MPSAAESLETEESRLRAAYEKRRRGELYSRFNPGHLFLCHEREKHFLKLLSRYDCRKVDAKKILEIGCGTGDLLRDLIKWGANPANITGVDVLPDRISEANRLCPTGMHIQQGNAANL